MIHYAAAHARQIQREPDTFWLSRLRKGPGMQYVNSIFGELLKPIDRRQFREIVERHDGNAYGANTVDGKTEARGPGSLIYEPYALVHQWGNPGNEPLIFLAFNINPEGMAAVLPGAPAKNQ